MCLITKIFEKDHNGSSNGGSRAKLPFSFGFIAKEHFDLREGEKRTEKRERKSEREKAGGIKNEINM